MKVLIAGASGAIGRPLIRCVRENRHAVTALVRSSESSRTVAEAGAESVVADALDAAAVQEAVVRVRPDAVINELTAMKNGRCRLHGGKSPGAPRGDRNGNYRHGLRTIDAIADRREAMSVRRMLRQIEEALSRTA
jgi:hypothetical protein